MVRFNKRGSGSGSYLLVIRTATALRSVGNPPSVKRLQKPRYPFHVFVRRKEEHYIVLSKRGTKSIMPEECNKDRNFEWDYSAYDK